MRYAFISDIHGNLHALDLTLADLEHQQIDQIICLGDIASLGPQPREVIARLRHLRIPILMGNHETYLLQPHLTQAHHPWLRAAEQWCVSLLEADELAFLSTFPAHLRLAPTERTSLFCFHGSPRSNEEFLYPPTPAETISEIFDEYSDTLFIGGHTHVQLARQHKGRLLLNPGSVGAPFEFPRHGPNQRIFPWAEYAIVEVTEEHLTTSLHRIPIHFEQLAQSARASGIPDVEFWLSTWVV